MLTREIRQTFLDYYRKNSHTILPSSSLVPNNDPSLMFTNAGMVQFKNVFSGKEPRKCPCAATVQKCVRAGGKHNDLDNVGHTARHHTFFEMLGNFSFGDYFKERAIELAWNFLTKELGLPQEKLLVTVYHTDEEAANLWKKIAGLTDDRIIRIASNDNFWTMGDTGPCGPCSEIFYDHGPEVFGGIPGSKDEDGDRYTEIWNLVFTQFDQQADGTRGNLPHPCIDTGTGLERLTAILQGVNNNFDTDIFQGIITDTQHLLNDTNRPEHRVAYNILADHLRAAAFLMADGVLPSNEGRGYVLRRIMRRAMRHGYQLQNSLMEEGRSHDNDLLLYRLLPFLDKQMADDYPELTKYHALIEDNLREEEKRFRETLAIGLKLLEEEIRKHPGRQQLPAEVAFKLYDTYGFPVDLTQDILLERHITVDMEGFDREMQQQKDRAKQAWKGSGDTKTADIYFELQQQLGDTKFLGYEQESCDAKILAIVNAENNQVTTAQVGETVKLITDQTVLYGESGGQVGDTGSILDAQGDTPKLLAHIEDVQKPLPHFHLHVAKVLASLKVGDTIRLQYDKIRRQQIRANHTATHLLHAALHKIIGETVVQKGSLVSPDYLRFDVSYNKAFTPEELSQIELEVNRYIQQNRPVTTTLMSKDEAIGSGACAFFGDKYEDQVRVLEVPGISRELCGGTHMDYTGGIGYFKITAEGAIAAGIRRLEAVTGLTAVQYAAQKLSLLEQLSGLLKTKPEELPTKLQELLSTNRSLGKQLEESQIQALMQTPLHQSGHLASAVFDQDVEANLLRETMLRLLKQPEYANSVLVFCGQNHGKVLVLCGVGPQLCKSHPAVDLLKQAIDKVQGKGGGGNATLAMGGGENFTGVEEFIQSIGQQVNTES